MFKLKNLFCTIRDPTQVNILSNVSIRSKNQLHVSRYLTKLPIPITFPKVKQIVFKKKLRCGSKYLYLVRSLPRLLENESRNSEYSTVVHKITVASKKLIVKQNGP